MKKLLLFTFCVCFCMPAIAGITDEFITIWQTDNPGESDSNQVRFYGQGNGYTIVWEEVGNSANSGTLTAGTIAAGSYQLITFPSIGTYRVRVDPTDSGTFTNFKVNGDKQKIIEIAQWGTTQWTDWFQAFRSCYNLDITASDTPHLSGLTSLEQTFAYCYGLVGTTAFNSWHTGTITDMSGMFWGAKQFNQDLDNWNTSNVENMFNMFEGAEVFNGDITTWNTASVTNMGSMFKYTDSFNQAIGNWDVSSVTSMQDMFFEASKFNQVLSGWHTGSVTNMAGMFYGAKNFNQPLDSFNTSSVTNMALMFRNTNAFNQPIGNWDVDSVTNMNGMFYNAVAFNQPIGSWNTSSVTDMSTMFYNAVAFNQPIGNWSVDSVTDMGSMFYNASSFNQPLNGWNTSALENARYLFRGASQFNQPIGNWSVDSVTNMEGMFYNAVAFNQPLNSWNTSALQNASDLFRGASQFNQPLDNWDISGITELESMFEDASSFNQDLSDWDWSSLPQSAFGFLNNSGMDCINYSLLINALADNSAISSGVSLGVQGMVYDTTALAAHNYLTNTKGWFLDGDAYVPDCNTVLSLPFNHFDAEYVAPFAVLTWVSENEETLDFYEVEQSLDGRHFNRIGVMDKQLGSSSYTYRHIQHESVAYYRIKMVNHNGEATYSETRVVRVAPDANQQLTLFPNPAEGSVLHLNSSREMQVELYNQLGERLGNYSLKVGANTIDISALPAGLYWFRNAALSQKLVIIR